MRVAVLRKRFKKFWRTKRKLAKRLAPIVILFTVLTGIIVYRSVMPPQIDQALYRPLLNTIAEGESNGNYNAYFGNASNTDTRFTTMTVKEVIRWQAEYVANGSKSSAVGRYQIIQPTLQGLVAELDIKPYQLFDAALQDRMAIALMERRGAVKFVENKLSREEFAANLAKEWAALPKIVGAQPTQSYYDGDGLNKARIGVDDVLLAIDPLKQQP